MEIINTTFIPMEISNVTHKDHQHYTWQSAALHVYGDQQNYTWKSATRRGKHGNQFIYTSVALYIGTVQLGTSAIPHIPSAPQKH
jgi:hypothetical protein